MDLTMGRREFLRGAAACGAFCLAARRFSAAAPAAAGPGIISPGCRGTKVRVAKLYLGVRGGAWPTPTLDLDAEIRRYETEFASRPDAFDDIEFVTNELVSDPKRIAELAETIRGADGVLAIHLSMGIGAALRAILALGKPTALFAAPYSGHEWASFGALRKEEAGKRLECFLTSDFDALAVAVRPFRAIHHLREARIVNVTARPLPVDYVEAIGKRFGTGVVAVDRERVLAAYEAVPEADAREDAARWIREAVAVVEPPEEEIVRSSRLAFALRRILDEEKATVMTVDCYGSMYRKLPAFPCLSHTRMNDMGLAGICESDLRAAMTFILFQSLTGRPGFISDPTVDVSRQSILLAHCMGTRKMDGPGGEAAPYKIRTIMERQEGAVCQVRMRIGEKATQAILAGTDLLLCFTGRIIDAPESGRGCRTKIEVRVDGDPEALWQNWSHGLHRVTCYGDVRADLQRFCRYMGIRMVDEAVPVPEAPATA
ncbi:MAG: hypothetical protein JXP34_24655 [Planctomycetes bacterium]|nr:hypothetical protein [Planctomycetota bacterium]